jgi:hypothetical protein
VPVLTLVFVLPGGVSLIDYAASSETARLFYLNSRRRENFLTFKNKESKLHTPFHT